MVYAITRGVEVKRDVSKGSAWKELFLSILASIPYFTHGIETTALTTSDHTGHFNSYDGVPWSTTVLVLASIISGPLFSYTIDKFGRKTGLFIINLVQATSLIPLFLLNDTSVIYLHVLAGIVSGGLATCSPVYIMEISSKRTRSFNLPLMMAMTTAGYWMNMVTELELLMYIMMALVAVQFVSLLVLCETPSYLVKVGKIESAKSNFAKLRCLAPDNTYVISKIDKWKIENENAKVDGGLTLRNLYRNKIWWDSFKIGIVLYTVMILCGSIVFLDEKKALMQLKIAADPDKTLVLATLLAGSIFGVISCVFVDRKYVLSLGFTIMVLATGILAVYTQADLTVNSLRWLPVVSLGILVFGYGLSWALPTIILVEILNIEIRAPILAVTLVYSEVLKLIHLHTFQYVEDYIGIYTSLYIFACINLTGLVYALFAVPNVRNKNLKQIERQIKRIPLPA